MELCAKAISQMVLRKREKPHIVTHSTDEGLFSKWTRRWSAFNHSYGSSSSLYKGNQSRWYRRYDFSSVEKLAPSTKGVRKEGAWKLIIILCAPKQFTIAVLNQTPRQERLAKTLFEKGTTSERPKANVMRKTVWPSEFRRKYKP